MRRTCTLIAGLAVAGLIFPLQAQNARLVAQKTFPTVVLLVMEDKNGHALSLGSGFFVQDGVVATNMHVIEGAARGYAKLMGQNPKHEVSGIIGADSAHDLVLLAVTARAPVLPLGQGREVNVGDEVYVVGNPLGLEGTISQGIVSGIRQVGPDTLLQITAPISPGSSGGPVLNTQGVVIGVAVATFRGGQNLNFAIPASYLASLLSQTRPLIPLSASTSARQGKSITEGLGRRSSAGIIGTQFAWKATNLLAFYGDFSFSLRNQLREPVEEVRYLAVFYDRYGKPIETHEGTAAFREPIPPGLAKRETGSVDDSVRPLTVRVEIRVLDFKLAGRPELPIETPQTRETESLASIPREWTNLQEGNSVTVRLDGDYLYEQGKWADGRYIQEGSFACDTKRQDHQWVGKCRYTLLLREGYLVSPKWCTVELDEVISSVSPRGIEGESQQFGPAASAGDCPSPAATRSRFVYIPKE